MVIPLDFMIWRMPFNTLPQTFEVSTHPQKDLGGLHITNDVKDFKPALSKLPVLTAKDL